MENTVLKKRKLADIYECLTNRYSAIEETFKSKMPSCIDEEREDEKA